MAVTARAVPVSDCRAVTICMYVVGAVIVTVRHYTITAECFIGGAVYC